VRAKRHTYTSEEIDLIKNNYGLLPKTELCSLLNLTYNQIRYIIDKYAIQPVRRFNLLKENQVKERLQKRNLILLGDYTGNRTKYKIVCHCGKQFEATLYNVFNNSTKSCGCTRFAHKGTDIISLTHFHRIHHGAKVRNKKFNITIEYITELLKEQNFTCALSGIKIFAGYNKKLVTASLDCIDPAKDYIVGNVWWVHKHINVMKLNHKLDYFIYLCSKIGKYNENKSKLPN
jgi:hypothetical protein